MAFNGVEVPEQIVAVPDAETTGTGFTVIVFVVVPEQEPVVPVIVYVVVTDGFATGFAIVVLLKPVPGDQTKDVAPDAVNVVLLPAQIVVVPVTETVGEVVTVIVTCATSEQVPDNPVTV